MEYIDNELGIIIKKAVKRVKEVEKGYTFFQNRDILFAKITPCMENGKCAIANSLINGIGFGSTEFHVLRAKEKIIPEWIYYYLRQESTRRNAELGMTGSAGQKRVPSRFLEDILIPLPSPSEQNRITSILEKADRLRRLRRYALELSSTYLQTVFLEMFGDPVTNPRDYEAVRLSEQINLVGGYAFKSEEFVSTGIPVIRIGTVNMGSFDASNLVYLPDSFAETYKRFLLYPGDLVITLTGTVGKDDYANVYLLGNHFKRYFLNQRVAKITINQTVFTIEYILHVFKHPSIKRILTIPSRGIRQANISDEDILSLYIPVPPLPLQQKFAQIVQEFERLRAHQREAARQAEHLFQALLHQAFEGELEPKPAALPSTTELENTADTQNIPGTPDTIERKIHQLFLAVE